MKMQPRLSTSLILGLVALVMAGTATAEWSHDPYQNLNMTTNVMDGGVVPVRSYTDGAGGIISVWLDQALSYALQAQRVDPTGTLLWGPTGRSLVPGGIINGVAGIAPDGNGGLFVTWSKVLTSNTLVYVQHFDGHGNPIWASDGVAMQGLVIMGTVQTQPQVVADGAGGAVVAWIDASNDTHEIYVQRFNAAGSRVWSTSSLAADSGTQVDDLTMAPGSNPGASCLAFAAYSATTGWDIYGQMVGADGTVAWSNWHTQMEFSAWSEDQRNPQIVSFNGDGVFATWSSSDAYVCYDAKDRYGSSDWTIGGQMFFGLYDNQTDAVLVAGSDGEAFLAFFDHAASASGGGRIVANRFAGNARGLWAGNIGGTILEEAPFVLSKLGILADGAGGLFLSWKDDHAYAQKAERVNANGQPCWTAEREAFSKVNEWGEISLVPDDEDGFYAGFLGVNPGETGYVAMAQKIDGNGFLGDNGCQMLDVADMPNDQGGELVVSWQASPLDNSLVGAIASYSIWVEDVGPMAGKSTGAGPANALIPDAELAAMLSMDELAVARMRTAGWTFAGQVPAIFESEYSAFCPSFGDSTAAGTHFTRARVIAHHQDPNTFWTGPALEGYSVDNLAPGAPLALAAENNSGAVDLTWTASGSHDEDLAEYRIYRGTVAGFARDASTLLGNSATTDFRDQAASGTVFYRVTAVDVHGNESLASGEVMAQLGISAVGALPAVFNHRGNYPNPFNPMTRIAFDLPAASQVRVAVYDASGQLVKTLISETMAAGQHEVRWNGQDSQGRSVSSGLYFSRVEAGEFTGTRSMMLVR